MSAKLISEKSHVHDFRDDLESTIYILLWVSLMYSKTSDSENAAGFLNSVLDPPRFEGVTYSAKPDFLRARTFFTTSKFPDRPRLYALLNDLANLFAVRYEEAPTAVDLEIEALSRQHLETIPEGLVRKTMVTIHLQMPTVQYIARQAALADHKETLEYFNKALENSSEWPSDDAAMPLKKSAVRPKRKMTRSSWNSESTRKTKTKKDRISGANQDSGVVDVDG
jgi:hypothetical protein